MEQYTADAEFWMEERADEDGRVRLELIGELDIAGATGLEARLQALVDGSSGVVLDLHRLQFIDSSGLRVLVSAVTKARREHRTLVLEETLSPQVRQIVDLLELRDLFWPPPS